MAVRALSKIASIAEQLPVLVGQAHQAAGVFRVLPRAVNLQLHAEIAAATAVKDGVGLVGVVLNFPVLLRLAAAAPAQRVILICSQ